MANVSDGHEYEFDSGHLNEQSIDTENELLGYDELFFIGSIGCAKVSFDSKLPAQVENGEENHIYRGEN